MADYGYEDFTIEREPLTLMDYVNMIRRSLYKTVAGKSWWKKNLQKKGMYEGLSSPYGKYSGILGAMNNDILNATITGGKYVHPAAGVGIPAAYNFVKNLKREYDIRTDPIVIENYTQLPGPAGSQLNEFSGSQPWGSAGEEIKEPPIRSPHL